MTACPFCQIVAGDQPAHLVFADEVATGFLDARPVFHGHVMVVTTPHLATLTDLPTDALGPYFARVQAAAAAVRDGASADGTFVAMNNVVSQSVPHLHTHVVPRRRKDGLRGFFWPRTRYASDDEAATVAASIRDAYRTP